MNFYKALIFGVSTLAIIEGYAGNGFSSGKGGSDDEPSKQIQNLRSTDFNNNGSDSAEDKEIKKLKSESESGDDSQMDADTPKTTGINPTEKDMEFLSGFNELLKTSLPPEKLLQIYKAALNGEVLNCAELKGLKIGPETKNNISVLLKILSGKDAYFDLEWWEKRTTSCLDLFRSRINDLEKGAIPIFGEEKDKIENVLKFHGILNTFIKYYIECLTKELSIEGITPGLALDIYKAVLQKDLPEKIQENSHYCRYLMLMKKKLIDPKTNKLITVCSQEMAPYVQRLLDLLKGAQPILDNEMKALIELLSVHNLPNSNGTYLSKFMNEHAPDGFKRHNILGCGYSLEVYFNNLKKYFSVTPEDLETAHKKLGTLMNSDKPNAIEALQLVRFLDSYTIKDTNETYLQEFVDNILADSYLEVSPIDLEKVKTYMSFMSYDDRVKIASLPDLFWESFNNNNNSLNKNNNDNKYESWQKAAIHQMLASNDYVFYVDDSNMQTQEKILKLIQSKVETFVNGGYQGYTSFESLKNRPNWIPNEGNNTLVVSQDELEKNKTDIEKLIEKNPDLKLLVDVKSIAKYNYKKVTQLSKEILNVKDLRHLILVNTRRDITDTPWPMLISLKKKSYDSFNLHSLVSLDMRGLTRLKEIQCRFMVDCPNLENIQLPLNVEVIGGLAFSNSLKGDHTFILPNVKSFFQMAFDQNLASSLNIIAPKLDGTYDFCCNSINLTDLSIWAPIIGNVNGAFASNNPNLKTVDISSFPENGVKTNIFLTDTGISAEELKSLREKITLYPTEDCR